MMIHIFGYTIPLAVAFSLLTATVIPAVSALLSRQKWNRDVLGALTVALSLVSGFVSELAAHPDDYRTGQAFGTALVAFLIAAASNSALWRDSRAERKLLAVGAKG